MREGRKFHDLYIIEKYDEFLNYIYPAAQNIPRKHGVLKEGFIRLIFEQPELFYKAIKSGHKSKIYEADAGIAAIKHRLRFLADDKRKLITKRQHQVASVKLAETGKLIGKMLRGRQDSG